MTEQNGGMLQRLFPFNPAGFNPIAGAKLFVFALVGGAEPRPDVGHEHLSEGVGLNTRAHTRLGIPRLFQHGWVSPLAVDHSAGVRASRRALK